MNLIIFPSLFLLLIYLSSIFYSALPTSVDDRLALLAIKSKIHDPRGVLNSWNDSLPICEWYGVTCGTRHPQRVVGLDLAHSNLVGTLSPYVGNLSFLHLLYLTNNTFRGYIPPQIGNLVRLRFLSLQNNTFEGEIPANLSQCLNIKELYLGDNHLTGIITSQLGILSNLEILSLYKNRLEGDLLNTVVINMTSLQILSAGTNSFKGSIPGNIGITHKNLSKIGIEENNISGSIPPSFYNLSFLQVVDLNSNQLQGILPLDIGFRLRQLTLFHISGNFFHGKLPVSLSNLTHLKVLSVHSNNFISEFTFSAINMPNLTILEASNNYLGTGKADDLKFLKTLVNCTKLKSLECSTNNFGGIIPDSIGNLSELTTLNFQENKIYGNIPSSLYNLINLETLGLLENQLTGNLSPHIEKLTKLEIFGCNDNYLTGTIPNSWGNLSKLSVLYLENNRFQGTIPSSLGSCNNLLYLRLSHNKLSGALPPQLLHASSMLVQLFLDHNQLQGIIPEKIGQLSNLVLFDITGNTFSGELPTTLSSCNELVELYMGGNYFTGSIPPSFKSLTSLSFLNLSHNNLSGPIPNFFSNLPLMALDLSFNNFDGEVPRKGVFKNLSAFTLLGNSKVCGGIPELHLPICPSATSKRKSGKLSVAVIVIIVVAFLVVGLSIVSLVYFLLYSKRKPSKPHESELKEPFSKVSYDMLLKATDRFSETNLVGAGRFGSVFKGVLHPESGVVVAVKVISLEQEGAIKSFMAECEALRSTRHRNLLKIVTVCSSTDFQGNDFKALVYEFMPNGSLHQWIHNDQPLERTLNLLQRVEIAIDVASALDYLHNGCDIPIIHCDLKPSNILLDDDMVAHVGDFGLARFHLHTTANNSSTLKGTVGYAAPEYGLGSMVSKEGDIYSYGIVLIEMLTAQNPTDSTFEGGLDLHHYAKSAALSNQLMNIIDPSLLDDGADAIEANEDEILAENDRKMKCINSLFGIGVKCSMESPQDRLKIEDAIGELLVTRDILLKELHVIRAVHT